MVLNVLAGHRARRLFGAFFEPLPKRRLHRSSLKQGGPLRGATRVSLGGKSGTRQSRRSGERTRPRTRTALSCREAVRPDAPRGRPRQTRGTSRGGTTRTRLATSAPQPGMGGQIPEKRRGRWSLLRGPLAGDEARNIYTMSRPRGGG